MSFSPLKFREMILQLLFSIDVGESLQEDLIPFLMRELAVSRKNVKAAYEKAKGIWEKREELDETIAGISKDYAFERIHRVERNILRLAFYELLFETENEPAVVVAQSMRLCRKFSTPEAASFVNAILDEHPICSREKQNTE